MSKRIDRRQALGALGTISLGGLLAACGKDSGGGSASVATTAGETATVEPKTTTSEATSALFDDAAGCTLTVEQTEGPYYFDADRIRTDIREDREGTRLRLALRVRDASSCKPIPDAVVDIWHADAGGAYSGFDGATAQTRYLRGAQVTNAAGVAEFTTIYPGWYHGPHDAHPREGPPRQRDGADDAAVLRRRRLDARLRARRVLRRAASATSSTTPTASSTRRS